ncbi:MAG: 23S rRNA (guanosine(2251)-2'-O)-methyltransferase RlmB [Clostridia bacterium]|nr:23S rRNA (guanosine(2251)-2'-O)-methyltransferase RlmB [Clostridia bacterium]
MDRRKPVVRDSAPTETPEGIIFGRNAVRELLKSGRPVDKIFVRRGDREGSINVIFAEAAERKIPIVEVEKEKLDRMCCGGVHQGVAASAAQKEYVDVEDILKIAEDRGEMPFIVILDGVEDPHNLGAVIRSADCAGAHGVIIPKRRSATLTSVVAKTSAGALEHMAVAKVGNLATEIDKLKEKGVWIYSAEAGGESIYSADLDRPSAFVFGSEGAGVSRLIKEKSDYIISIPLYGEVNSLNVSAAAAVVLCEAAHSRHKSTVKGK